MMPAPLVAVLGSAGCCAAIVRVRRVERRGRTAPLRRPRARQLPAAIRAPLTRALGAAMVPCSAEDAVLATLTAAAVAGLAGVALVPTLAPLLVLMVLAGAPLGLRLARGRRDAARFVALPELVQRIAFELAAGASLEQALVAESNRPGPLGEDLAVITSRVAHGLPFPEALGRWVEMRPRPEIRAVAGALGVAVESGAPAAAALHGVARGLRDRMAAEAEARTQSVQARLSAIVVGGAPLGFLLLSALADPGAQAATFGTGVGRACLIGGLSLEAAAVVWIRRIVAGPA